MSNSGKVWDVREYYKLARNNQANDPGNTAHFGQGYSPSLSNNLLTVNLSTVGNATDFGDATMSGQSRGGTGTLTKGFNTGGRTPDMSVIIDTVNYRSLGNATDFGDLSEARAYNAACTDNIRVVVGGGNASPAGAARSDTIDYITAASTGNAADFGNLSSGRLGCSGGGDNTRGIFYSGYGDPGAAVDRIDFITFTSVGNAIDFGNAATSRYYNACDAASTTRTISGGGYTSSNSNVIEFVTTQTTGNGTDFGDLTVARTGVAGSANGTRMIFAGGTDGSAQSTIDFITVATSGNASDFGDIDTGRSYLAKGGCNGNGGLPRDGSPQRPSVTYMPGSGRVFNLGGWASPSYYTSIDMIVASTLGNASDFGDLPVAHGRGGAGMSSLTRGLIGGGDPGSSPNLSNVIDSVEFASQGNGADFGDLTESKNYTTGTSSTTRGLRMGGGNALGGDATNVIDYVTIASAGNATDFGDQTVARNGGAASGSSTRGLCAGGRSFEPSSADTNIIDYVTISSTGNATDFGDLTVARSYFGGSSSSTRSVVGGGYGGSTQNVIDYVTIASTGNATDFGDLLGVEYNIDGGSNSTRAIWFGGSPNATDIQYVEIATTSDAIDFGDLSTGKTNCVVVSDSHGGLQA